MLKEAGLSGEYYRLASLGSRPVAATPGGDAEQLAELDSPVFLEGQTTALDGNARSVSLHLEGVHCAACVWLVERLPSEIPGVSSATLDLTASRLDLEWQPDRVQLSTIGAWLGDFGYTPHPLDQAAQRTREAERRGLFRVGLAWALAANVMLIASAFYVGLDAMEDARLFTAARWLSLLLATPAVFVVGRGFFQRAGMSVRLAWRHRSWQHLHVDVPVAIGLGGGFAHSAWSTVSGTGEVWFDSLVMLTAALLTSRWLQDRSRRSAAEAVSRLHGALPTMATVVTDAGPESRPVTGLRQADLVRVVPGALFPSDGVLESGSSTVDRSVMTGESKPEEIGVGSIVLAGTRNLTEAVVLRVTAAGDSSRLGGLLRLAGQAEDSPTVELAQRISGPFVAVVLLLAALSGALWLQLNPSMAVQHVVALLVVTCPCALGMATPLAMAVAAGRGAAAGVFIRNGAALERLSSADLIVLDKTGTLTEGHPRIVDSHGDPALLDLAACLEEEIRHPVAEALRHARTRTDLTAHEVVSVAGFGLRGRVGTDHVLVGSPRWLAQEAEDPERLLERVPALTEVGLTPIAIARNGQVGWIGGLGDSLRGSASPLVAFLKERGVEIHLISGDHPEVTRRIGASVGIEPDRIHSNCAPEQKREVIRGWRAEGRTVIMVGDGLNDAPALAQSDVGIAVDSGTQTNRFAADVVLTREPLVSLQNLLVASRHTMRVIRRNLGISLAYNLVAAALAMAGLVTPLLAAVAMPVSSLVVVGLSLRLPGYPPIQRESLPEDAQLATARNLLAA